MMTKEDLLNTLKELVKKEFKDFKWFLKDESLEGHQAIKASQLEKAERRDTVDLMVQTYQLPGAVEVTKKLLKKINRNDLLQSLSDSSSGPEDPTQQEPHFCKTGQTCVFKCYSDHKTHEFVPLKEEYEGKKAELGKTEADTQQTIQKRRLKIQEIKHFLDLIKKAADREKAEGDQVFFTDLKESVERSLNEFIEKIEEKQRTTEKKIEDFIKELEQEMSEVEKRCSSYETVVKVMNQLEETLSKGKKKLYEAELKGIQRYAVDVTLDPETAHPSLILSDDGKQVNHRDVKKKLPDNPERFSSGVIVLGKQSVSSGRFYFEVQVKGKTDWDLGVARESINRKGTIIMSTEDGYWIMGLRNGNEYRAINCPGVNLSLKSQPQKVGVFVDYEKGLVSFYDVDAAAPICSFTGCSFKEKLYPFFCPCKNDGGKNSAPLIICPVNQTA